MGTMPSAGPTAVGRHLPGLVRGRAAPRRVPVVAAALALATALHAGTAAAQLAPTDRTRPRAAPAAPSPPKTAFVTDLGFLSATGNTEVTTINVAQRLTHSRGFWRVEQQLGVVYGEAKGKENANLLRASLGGEYALRPWAALAAGVLYDRNRFAGIARRTEEYAGMVFRARSAARDTLRLETGASLTQQQGVDGTQRDFPAARAAAWYKRGFGAKAYFLQTVEVIPNLEASEDWRLNSESSLVAPIARFVGLKAGYVLRYDNLPEPRFQKSDRFVTTGLQVTF